MQDTSAQLVMANSTLVLVKGCNGILSGVCMIMASQYEPVATLNECRGSEVIHFNSLFNFQPFCVLLHIDADSCTSPPYEKWKALSVRKREGTLLFPGIIYNFCQFYSLLSYFSLCANQEIGNVSSIYNHCCTRNCPDSICIHAYILLILQ